MGSRQSNERPKPGDLIEIYRFGFQHWAVYIGDGYVVHLTADGAGASSNSMSAQNKKAIVKKEKMRDVVGNNKWRVNNILDKTHEPLSVEEIIKKALLLVGDEVSYHLLSDNCEHFATLMRYGISRSQQVQDVGEGVFIGSVAGVILGVVAVVGALVGGK